MRTEQEMDQALAAMAERRIHAWRDRARQDIALALLTAHGSVNEEQVEAELAGLPQLDEQSQRDQVAAKALAAVLVARRDLEAAHAAVQGTQQKVTKYGQLLDAARADLQVARDLVDALAMDATRAEELAEYSANWGDPNRVAPGRPISVSADIADGDGKAGAQ